MADSVLRVMLEANKKLLEKWKGDASMFESLLEIMEPQLQIREEQMRKEWRKEEITRSINMLKEFGHVDSDIKAAIMNQYQLSSTEADEYL